MTLGILEIITPDLESLSLTLQLLFNQYPNTKCSKTSISMDTLRWLYQIVPDDYLR